MKSKKEEESQRIRKIVVGTDFSPASNRAFRFSVWLAKRLNAEIIAVFVKNADDLAVAMRMDIHILHREVGHLKEKVNRFIDRKFQLLVKNLHVDHTSQIRFVILDGKAWQEILKLAKKEHADLIVTGTRSRSMISNLLLGSTARELIVHSSYPVLTLNSRKRG